MSGFQEALEKARELAREAKADACVYFHGARRTYHAALLSKADPLDVVVEVSDDNGVVFTEDKPTNCFTRKTRFTRNRR